MTALTFDTKGGSFAPAVPEGPHAAYLVSIIDLGKQNVPGKYGGIKHQVLVAFEFPDFIVEFEAENGVKHSEPAIVNKRFTASMHPKASLRKFVEEIAGKRFATDEQAKTFDLGKLLGRTVLCNIQHNTTGDRTYCNLQSVQPCPAKMRPEQIQAHRSWVYSTKEPDTQLFEQFPTWLQKVISERVIDDPADKTAKASVAPDLQDEFDDDIPF